MQLEELYKFRSQITLIAQMWADTNATSLRYGILAMGRGIPYLGDLGDMEFLT